MQAFLFIACVLTGAVSIVVTQHAERERRADGTVREQPKIVTKEGNLEFQSATNHNISFDLSGNSDVVFGTTSINGLIEQVSQVQKSVDDLKVQFIESPCTKNVNLCGPGACISVSKAVNSTGYRCLCGAAFTGSHCESLLPSIPGASCANVICFNRGVCGLVNGNAECACPHGFFGQRCELTLPSTCQFDISDAQGVIKSPGYPSAYPSNATCIWRLSNKPGRTFVFMFSGFGIESSASCTKDSLKIYDGLSKSSPLITNLCGSTSPARLVSSSNNVLIEFTTDGEGQIGIGFSLMYFEGEKSLCGNELTESTGLIVSPQWPLPYNKNVRCSWLINLPGNESLSFEVTQLTLSGNGSKCTDNNLEIFDGPNDSSPLLGTFCLSVTPPVLTSSSNQLYVRYQSDGSGSMFRASYDLRCGGILTALNGRIQSPFFPGFYPHKKRCVWNIRLPIGNAIRANFIAFDIEESASCVYDYVAFVNGPTATSGPLINQTCGSRPPLPIVSSMHDLTVVFQTDGSHSFRGFMLEYEPAPDPCGGVFRGLSGAINSPQILTNNPNSLRCVYTMVSSEPDKRIALQFSSFNLEPDAPLCRYDFIRLYDGPDTNSPILHNTTAPLGRFCGTTFPPLTLSTGGILTLAFFSDQSIPSDRFAAFWSAVGGISRCDYKLTTASGAFRSEGFPNNYPHRSNCSYAITLPDTNLKVRLNFTAFRLEDHSTCSFDRLTIYDGPDATFPTLGRFCGNQGPGLVFSSSHQLYVTFQSDSSGSEQGFVANYVSEAVGCGGDLHLSSGFIRSINYPSPYPHNTQCDWRINTKPGNTVVLTIVDFAMETTDNCFFDHLLITDGRSSSNRVLARLCGAMPTVVTFQSTGNVMFIRFRSDISTSAIGFELRYTSGCGGVLTDLSGTFNTPNFPGNYPSNRVCNWTIQGRPNDVINVQFHAFDIEPSPLCSFDHLAISNGTTGNPIPTTRYCGSAIPPPVTTTTSMFLSFISDVTLTHQGFNASYTIQGCSADFTALNGTFATPNYPSNYPPGQFCAWKISVTPGQRVTLKFSEVDVEDHVNCSFDSVTIYNGPNANGPVVGKYCSRRSPITLTSFAHEMYVVFRSDVSNSGTGFKVDYFTSPDGCGGEFTAPTGFIHSPRYPQNYPPNSLCEWIINVDNSQVATLDFLEFKTEETLNCMHDFVQVFDGIGVNSPMLASGCGTNITKKVQATGSTLVVKFQSDQAIEEKGFRASFGTGCGQTIDVPDSNGILTSPNYPRNYEHNSNCNWLLRAASGEVITLQFSNIDIEFFPNCTFDYVQIFNGDNDQAPSLGRFCGRHIPPSITSTGNVLFIRLVTDDTSSRQGFRLLHRKGGNACGGTIRGDTGMINSPMYPLISPSGVQCDWTIMTNAGSALQLSFAVFDLGSSSQCSDASVQVFDGITSSNQILLPPTCGTNLPQTVTTTNETMHIRYKSGLGRRLGFQATFLTLCNRVLTATEGFIESPAYPSEYPPNEQCSWIIQAPVGETVTLEFEELDIEEHQGCFFDFIEIREGNTASSPQIGRYCGTSTPPTYVSQGRYLFVRFQSDFNSGGRGFRLKYTNGIAVTPCNQVLSATNNLQHFQTPNFPNPYPNNQVCEWLINAQGTHTIRLNFESFQLEEPFLFCFGDIVSIYDGPSRASQPIANLCGNLSQVTQFSTTGSSMLVRFTSDGSISKPGFRASYVLGCGGRFAWPRTSGQIRSPALADQYAPNNTCGWEISLSTGNRLFLDFDYVDMENSTGCTNDYLTVHNGPSESSPIIERLCGQRGRFNLTINGHQAYLRFVTNAAVHGTGFSLNYTIAEECQSAEQLFITDANSIQKITSPRYPASYPTNSNCGWILNVPVGQKVRLTLSFLDIEPDAVCLFDSLSFYDGGSDSSPLLLRKCGNDSSSVAPIISTSNQLFVRFTSDSTVSHRGFEAFWRIGCGGFFSSSSGIIESPGFPSSGYPANVDCEYNIQLPSSRQIQLDFESFSLQAPPCLDYLRIYDGSSRTDKIMTTLCGTQSVSSIQSSGSRLLLDFHSDGSIESNGFKILYNTVGPTCGGFLSGNQGTFVSPNYPANYPVQRVCEWTIQSDALRRIRLTFNSFDLEDSVNCTKDFLEVRAGSATGPLLGTYCGNTIPSVNSTSNRLYIKFTSNDDSILASGFSVTYNADLPGCGGRFRGESGTITSPQYPGNYPANSDCVYIISVPSGTVAIKMNDFQFELGNTCVFDYLQIRNGPTAQDHLAATLCGDKGPGFNYTTVHQTIYVRFVSDAVVQMRGFSMEWSNSAFGRAKCGGIVSGSISELMTPNYPNNYPNDVDCEWLVQVPAGRVITAVPEDIQLEGSINCAKDYLAIYNGDSVDAPLIIRICGEPQFNVPPFQSSGRSLFVVLHTDSAGSGRGAKAVFNSTIVGCGQVLSDNSGIISTPNYPSPYPANAECDWTIRVRNNAMINILFQAIDMESHINCIFDYVEVFDGPSRLSPSLGRFCGVSHPSPIRSTSNVVYILLRTDSSAQRNGFNLSYTTECGGNVFSKTGVILSPNYPNPYPINSNCDWKIRVPGNNRVLMLYNNFDLPGKSANGQCNSDYVQHGSLTKDVTTQERMCGGTLPTPITSDATSLDLLFTSDGSAKSNTGFRSTFSSICGGTLDGTNGTLVAHTVNGFYLPHEDCTYIINVPANNRISYKFSSFVLELHIHCEYDYVELRDGAAISSPLIGRFCGSNIPPSFTTTSNSLFVRFVSDLDIQNTGFTLQYGLAAPRCGADLTAPGNIQSTNFSPNNVYPPNDDCTWTITAPLGMRVQIRFIAFQVEGIGICPADSLVIRDGYYPNSPQLQRLCGSTIPQTITTAGNRAFIHFHSDATQQLPGFSLNFAFVTGCGDSFQVTSDSKTLTSPSYPANFDANVDCQWVFAAQPGMHILLTFTDFQMPSKDTNGICTDGALEVDDSFLITTTPRITHCGNGPIASFTSDANHLRLHLRSTVAAKGFSISYKTTDCSQQLTAPSGMISSPNYPLRHPSPTNCLTIITAPVGQNIRVFFKSIDILESDLCRQDYVLFRDGNVATSPLIGNRRWCGTVAPNTIVTTGNRLYVRFFAIGSVRRKGFVASYTTSPAVCGGPISGIEGAITSPNFPSAYNASFDCSWTITVEVGKIIEIKFDQFHLEPQINNSCSTSDFVQVIDPLILSIAPLQFCGERHPRTMKSAGNELTIRFKSNSNNNNFIGFKLEYISM